MSHEHDHAQVHDQHGHDEGCCAGGGCGDKVADKADDCCGGGGHDHGHADQSHGHEHGHAEQGFVDIKYCSG